MFLVVFIAFPSMKYIHKMPISHSQCAIYLRFHIAPLFPALIKCVCVRVCVWSIRMNISKLKASVFFQCSSAQPDISVVCQESLGLNRLCHCIGISHPSSPKDSVGKNDKTQAPIPLSYHSFLRAGRSALRVDDWMPHVLTAISQIGFLAQTYIFLICKQHQLNPYFSWMSCHSTARFLSRAAGLF